MPVDVARFLRHLVLEGVGEAGQERLAASRARAPAHGLRGEVARRYLERAGVGEVVDEPSPSPPASWVSEAISAEGAGQVLSGSLDALDELVAIVDQPK